MAKTYTHPNIMESIVHRFPLIPQPAYGREPIDDSLRLALGICSGRIPYIKRSELLILGMYEDDFDGYVEVTDKIKEKCENLVYNHIMHYPHS